MPLPTKDLPYLLAFSQINGLGSASLQRIFDYYKSFEVAWHSPTANLKQIHLPEKVIEQIQEAKEKVDPEKIYQEVCKQNIKIVSILDENYPLLLKQIHQPPFLLYYQGNLNLPQLGLTIVGSRQCTTYGQQTIAHLLQPLANQPITIVSGLAIGLDTLAHQQALANNLPTMAIIGSGLSRSVLYPRQNLTLAQKILEAGGALISELPPTTKAQPAFFPRRNRIMAGLTQATLVIEADITSGALITAKYALDFNREILAVPGSIFQTKSAGPNWLISQGAKIITKPEDLLEALALPTEQPLTEKPLVFPSNLAKQIYHLIQNNYQTVEQLTNQITASSPTDILVSLSSLELAGLIKKEGGNYFCL
ncbi:MAG: DNA-processing protein DprA [Candidatus Komeilibacteria bacterium]|nr:DNA-processing protein DprA [Candidatus Komeilibacteria bacterium]